MTGAKEAHKNKNIEETSKEIMAVSHYCAASTVLDNLEARRGGIKSLVFQSDYANKKLVYAVVAETMKYSSVLHILMRALYSKIGYVESGEGIHGYEFDIFAPRNKWLVRVMVYDLLFSARKTIQGGGKLKASVLRERTHLESALSIHMKEVGATSHVDLLPERLRGSGGAKLPR